MESVFEKLQSILEELFSIEPDDITYDTVLEDELELDSIDLVDLIMSIEEEFDFEVEEEDAKHIKTVGDVVNYIESKI